MNSFSGAIQLRHAFFSDVILASAASRDGLIYFR
jgi:hypothetical protein